MLELRSTQITDAGCATLAAALNSGTLPALEEVMLEGTRASAAAVDARPRVRTTVHDAVGELGKVCMSVDKQKW